jgi:AraC-like DNA-binding protein
LRKAAQLLRNPKARIDEIGATVGFEDPEPLL